MITINGPFIVALIIIIFLVVIKWIEWYLFQNGTFHLKRRNDKFKSILFFGKADLRRPWYVGIPFGVFVFVQSFVFDSEKWEIYLLVCIDTLLFVLIMFSDMFLMLRANKDFFSVEDRRKRYIRSQIAQLSLACIVFVAIVGSMQIHFEKKYADPVGLKESIEWEIEPTFEADWPIFTEGLAPVKKDDRYGFIDKQGNVIIPYHYEDSYNFYEGLAAVEKDKKWGYIDKEGQQIIPFLFDTALDFGDGLAPVQQGDQWIVIDKKGAVQFETDYNMIYPFHEGVAVVEVKDKKYKNIIRSNLIDKEGHLLFQKNYTFFDNYFNEGCIPVSDNETDKSFFLDINEKKVTPVEFIQAGVDEFYNYFSYSEGLVSFHNGEWNGSGENVYREGFKDRYGNIIIPAQFQNATKSSEGLIGLKVDGFWGFVKNPLPEAAWAVDPALWQEDRTQIATVEGLPIYAGELERVAYNIKKGNPELTGIPSYKKAFEQLKSEKAFEKYGKSIESDKIQYQIGNTYYRLLLLEKN